MKIFPLGDRALVIEVGSVISPEVHATVTALGQRLRDSELSYLEAVPAFTTLTVHYDPRDYAGGSEAPFVKLRSLIEAEFSELESVPAVTPRLVEIPVVYGGAAGPDLDFVASHTGLAREEIVALHSGTDYLVYMIGFAPGFPYLGGLDPRLVTPRRSDPRSRVPAGSVGIGGAQTGVYPLETPGGWQLIGRTDLRLFDPGRETPALLRAGDRVRFIPVGKP